MIFGVGNTAARLRKDYSPDYKLHFSMQEIKDEKEFQKLHDEIRNQFSVYNKLDVTLAQLREIKSILDNK